MQPLKYRPLKIPAMTCSEAETIFLDYHADPAVGKDERAIAAFSHAEACRPCWIEFDAKYCSITRITVQSVNQQVQALAAPITPDVLGMMLFPQEIHFLVKHSILCCYCELLLAVRRSESPPPDDRTNYE